ncbi:uncharacterized protein EDB91DRAFT_25546 [Suillus paluster]|uniref:uncharacterized protein n=1 Tax=Suillus paluster TaxID=48578 RepID=UPI001B87C564|nr:uncharacterized protein EDB91DRAFT_25546 [Suillus paluster]KAG1756582.1 hypothetical protein EDB91DRAFT_25546 [Suillus paluster]
MLFMLLSIVASIAFLSSDLWRPFSNILQDVLQVPEDLPQLTLLRDDRIPAHPHHPSVSHGDKDPSVSVRSDTIGVLGAQNHWNLQVRGGKEVSNPVYY